MRRREKKMVPYFVCVLFFFWINWNWTTNNEYFKTASSIYRNYSILFGFFKINLFYSIYIYVFVFFFFPFTDLSTATIRNVSLQVDPPSVRRGQHATFICSYDLGGAPLYSVKFYRGNHEFYRYSPSELPTSKVFQFVGFNVDVSLIQFYFNFPNNNFILCVCMCVGAWYGNHQYQWRHE